MFVLMWATLLFFMKDSSADTGASLEGRTVCYNEFCVTLREGEIRAEAGLCVEIPCSFNTSSTFRPRNIVWFKCEPSKPKCGTGDVIFSKNTKKVQPGFRGRVKLLEPNINQRNCSIVINDLTASDSGSYQLRVISHGTDGFQFSLRANVSVTDLTQKPTVMVPPLTEGQQTTLSCTAPGLCSGSAPEFTWTWGGGGQNKSNITGNIETENLSAFAQRHSSSLTFTPSAEHHGTNVSCKVSFNSSITTEETVTLNVSYVKKVKVSVNSPVREGKTLNLTCSVESFPPSLLTWTKLLDQSMQNETEVDLDYHTSTIQENQTETYLQEGLGKVTFSLSDVTAKDSGVYVCTAKHLNNTLKEEVEVRVRYLKTPVITGKTSPITGDTLNLTCTAESFPPSQIIWTFPGSDSELQNDTGSSTLIIRNVTTENSGRYICTVEHLDSTVSVYADVSVTWFPSILKNSGCKIQSQLLTCVCLSEGFPLPTIKWPLLENHTQYSVITAVTNHTVNSTITLTVKENSITSAECVSSNENGEVTKSLSIHSNMSQKEADHFGVLETFTRLEVIVAFFLGLLLSAVFCFLATKCKRKRQKRSGNLGKTLEMVSSQEVELIYAGQKDNTYQEVTEVGAAVAEEKPPVDLDDEPEDMVYASIDFSALKRRAVEKQEATETVYSEIRIKVKDQSKDDNQVEEEELVIVEDKKTKIPEEEEDKDVAVHSTVKDITEEVGRPRFIIELHEDKF